MVADGEEGTGLLPWWDPALKEIWGPQPFLLSFLLSSNEVSELLFTMPFCFDILLYHKLSFLATQAGHQAASFAQRTEAYAGKCVHTFYSALLCSLTGQRGVRRAGWVRSFWELLPCLSEAVDSEHLLSPTHYSKR